MSIKPTSSLHKIHKNVHVETFQGPAELHQLIPSKFYWKNKAINPLVLSEQVFLFFIYDIILILQIIVLEKENKDGWFFPPFNLYRSTDAHMTFQKCKSP